MGGEGRRARRSHAARVLAAAAALGWGLAVAPALADERCAPADRATAAEKDLYQQGRAFAAEGKWAEAARSFDAVLAMRTSAEAWIAAGIARERLADGGGAWGRYRRAATHPCVSAELRKKATDLAAPLEREVAIVELHVGVATLGATVTVDGREVVMAEDELALAPGSHEIVVRVPGYEPWRSRVEAEAGRRAGLDIALRSAEPKETEDPMSFGERHAASIVIGGLALGAGAAGLGLALRAYIHYGDLSARCAGGPAGCPEADRAAVRTEAIAADVLFGVAGAGALTAVVLFTAAEPGELPDPPGGTVVSIDLAPTRAEMRLAF